MLGLISNSVRHLTLRPCGGQSESTTASVPSETQRLLSRVNRPAHRRNQGLPGHAIVVLDRHLDTRRGPTRGGDPDPGQAWHAAAASRGSDSAPPRSVSLGVCAPEPATPRKATPFRRWTLVSPRPSVLFQLHGWWPSRRVVSACAPSPQKVSIQGPHPSQGPSSTLRLNGQSIAYSILSSKLH